MNPFIETPAVGVGSDDDDRRIYDELRSMAARLLQREGPGHTLQPTALVHEVFLRLMGPEDAAISFDNRRHFFASASNAMRRILVDSARRKAAGKRGGRRQRVEFVPEEIAAPEANADLLILNEALEHLAEGEPRIAELVQLRFFGGLTLKDAATIVGVSERTAQLGWAYARAWLLDAMKNGGEDF